MSFQSDVFDDGLMMKKCCICDVTIQCICFTHHALFLADCHFIPLVSIEKCRFYDCVIRYMEHTYLLGYMKYSDAWPIFKKTFSSMFLSFLNFHKKISQMNIWGNLENVENLEKYLYGSNLRLIVTIVCTALNFNSKLGLLTKTFFSKGLPG